MVSKGEKRTRGETEGPGNLGTRKRDTGQSRLGQQGTQGWEGRPGGLWKQRGGVWAPQRRAGAKANGEAGPLSGTKNMWRTKSPDSPVEAAGSRAVLCS